MINGAIIKSGPANWQILQQKKGYADISLSGAYRIQGSLEKFEVLARVVMEDTGEVVCGWKACDIIEGDLTEGLWQVRLQQIPAGGLYRVETCLQRDKQLVEWSNRGDMIHHLGVGDLYVIAGQSNSAGYGKDPIYDPPEIGIHILRNCGKWDLASHPLNESTDTIHEVNMEIANPGHSPYLNFAKILKRQLNYPIGLLQSSQGGSPLSYWNPDENGVLYRNMMDIIKSQGGSVRGILWYQGCADAWERDSRTYLDRFQCMVEHLRKDLIDDTLPILTVQLNRYVTVSDETSDRAWGILREAQRQAAERIPYVYVIPANDCTLSDVIHISSASNMMLGERLARIALGEIYGQNIPCRAPDILNAFLTEDNKIILEFKNIYQRLYVYDVMPMELPFVIEDDKGFIQIREYEITDKNHISLVLERAPSGSGMIHGAYEKNPRFFMLMDSGTHLPMLSFYGVEIKSNKA